MGQGHRKATGGKRLLAKVLRGRLLSSLDAERARRTVQHEDQRKRPETLGPVVFNQNVLPGDQDGLLRIAVGASRRDLALFRVPGYANDARQPVKDNAE